MVSKNNVIVSALIVITEVVLLMARSSNLVASKSQIVTHSVIEHFAFLVVCKTRAIKEMSEYFSSGQG